MSSPLLTALDSKGHVHLIVGSNPLASARCAKSIEVGAKPIVIAPADAEVHYVLAKRIQDGEVEWRKNAFNDTDISKLGRDEVDNVVDAVFVTFSGKGVSSVQICITSKACQLIACDRHTHIHIVQTNASPSQRGRRPQSMHLYAPIHTFRWTLAYWHHDVR